MAEDIEAKVGDIEEELMVLIRVVGCGEGSQVRGDVVGA